MEKHSEPGNDAAGSDALPDPAKFGFAASDLLPMLRSKGHEPAFEPLESDDADNAIGRTISRLDLEDEFATVYLTFSGGTYLAYASRVDEEGVILLDRFSEPAEEYSDYWIFDELEGETGPPPSAMEPEPGTGFHRDAWQASVGRTVLDLGWNEEDMQVFIHFVGGGYLTFAARAQGGSAYLLGYFSPDDPVDDEYVEFERQDGDGEKSGAVV